MATPRFIVVVIALCGCPSDDTPDDPQPMLLARSADWMRVADESADAFGDQRPAGTTCDDVMGYGIDPVGFAFEIKTDLCDYLTVRQETLVPLAAGDLVHVRIWHDELTAPVPSTGYVGFAIEREIVWHATQEIPHAVDILEGDVEVTRDLPVGSELQLHVHNHGINSWNILDVMCTTHESS
jgi:hypothetical protein